MKKIMRFIVGAGMVYGWAYATEHTTYGQIMTDPAMVDLIAGIATVGFGAVNIKYADVLKWVLDPSSIVSDMYDTSTTQAAALAGVSAGMLIYGSLMPACVFAVVAIMAALMSYAFMTVMTVSGIRYNCDRT